MNERTFQAGGLDFKLRKIDALQQFHIVRKIGPLLSEILPALSKVKLKEKEVEGLNEEQKFEEFAKILAPLVSGLSKLSDKDSEFVLFRLLSVVEVQQKEFNGQPWTDVATYDGIKMQNIELPILMQAAGRSLMYNLAGFLALSPRKSGA